MRQGSKHWIFILQALDDSTKLKTGHGIYIDLKKWCNKKDLNIIPKYKEITSKRGLIDEIDKIAKMIDKDDSIILHIESHGNYDEIWLVNDCIGWEEFFQTTRTLCEKVNSKIVFVLSMCRSKYSVSVLSHCERMPFQYLIASDDIVDSGPACLAFKKFYKTFVKSKNIQESFIDLQDYYAYFNKECPFLLLTP